MSVQRVRVGATAPTASDVIEYARELIATYGWNPGAAATKPGEDTVIQESSEEVGFTLHDAIGEACTRLSKAVGTPAEKDWSVTTPEGEVRQLRKEATALVATEILGVDDKVFNDKAASVDEVYAVLDAALAKAGEATT